MSHFNRLICFFWSPEWNGMWCIDQYDMVQFATIQTKGCCSLFKSHSKWCSFNTGEDHRRIKLIIFVRILPMNFSATSFYLTRYISQYNYIVLFFSGSFKCAQLRDGFNCESAICLFHNSKFTKLKTCHPFFSGALTIS